MKTTIKGFVFDLDGVITDTAHLHYLAWKHELAKYNIEYSAEENEPLKGLPRKNTLIAILKLKNKLNEFDDALIEQMCFNKNEQYKQMLHTELNSSAILPGVEQFLKELKAHDYKLAIASSSYNAPLILEKIGLKEYFDFIVNPANIKHGKPAPDIFVAAAVGINLTPQECVGFEDAPSGLEGIIKAQMHSVAIVPAGSEHLFKGATLNIPSTKELHLQTILNAIK
ncbi:beta-phosphoglucomutase [Mycoplasmopsis columboralis]|uniref:Beta-phosphoglucomutase (Beta-PGM) domain-containing protein n=1 Tax=Mycoplasmopsis columboralis TaxID=171282 RepID=A0A449B6N5_9BACT|nr:beta-phosphoglucomutase [Mycoplasmopsis columboralis]VEU76215.1 beta-phosphoglucomutase (beta-PGM) domain-containing protein [Mycoplasmopsis columboralis]